MDLRRPAHVVATSDGSFTRSDMVAFPWLSPSGTSLVAHTRLHRLRRLLGRSGARPGGLAARARRCGISVRPAGLCQA